MDSLTAPLGEALSPQGIISVRKPITGLGCVLLKDRILALAPREDPEISSRAFLLVNV